MTVAGTLGQFALNEGWEFLTCHHFNRPIITICGNIEIELTVIYHLGVVQHHSTRIESIAFVVTFSMAITV